MRLQDWIKTEDDSEELLPLCHTTRWETFEKILSYKSLSRDFSKFPDPNLDGVNQDHLVYLFYGMPFYIYEVGEDGYIFSEVTEDLPIGLIFKPELSQDVDRFYPFDTGALFKGRLKRILKCNSEEDYRVYEVPITNGVEMKKYVKRYFSTNRNYCSGNLSNERTATCPKEENLIRLFNYSVKSNIDLRQRAVEIHSLNDIPLIDSLQAIILPKQKSKKYSYLIDRINNEYPNIDIEYYRDRAKFSSESIRTSVLDATELYYEKNSNMNYPN